MSAQADKVNAARHYIQCAGGCGRSVRCHPAVTWVKCRFCSMAGVWDRMSKEKKKAVTETNDDDSYRLSRGD